MEYPTTRLAPAKGRAHAAAHLPGAYLPAVAGPVLRAAADARTTAAAAARLAFAPVFRVVMPILGVDQESPPRGVTALT